MLGCSKQFPLPKTRSSQRDQRSFSNVTKWSQVLLVELGERADQKCSFNNFKTRNLTRSLVWLPKEFLKINKFLSYKYHIHFTSFSGKGFMQDVRRVTKFSESPQNQAWLLNNQKEHEQNITGTDAQACQALSGLLKGPAWLLLQDQKASRHPFLVHIVCVCLAWLDGALPGVKMLLFFFFFLKD